MCPEAVVSGCVSGPFLGHVFCACVERESAEMVTEITDKHGDRKIRVHSGPVLGGVRAQKWSQKSPTNMETEKSVYILGVQELLVLSNFLVGTSNALR
jgi:hypothetical protein